MRSVRIVTILAFVGVLVVGVLAPALATRLADSPVGGPAVSASMDGDQEVPPSGVEATGFAIATINPGRGITCYELTHDLEPAPFGFHIHVGETGVNGPIVVNYFTDSGGVVPPNGCTEIDRELARQILGNPDGYYFNLHNEDFPGGAIRGQLTRDDDG